jgi:hypothetical protein
MQLHATTPAGAQQAGSSYRSAAVNMPSSKVARRSCGLYLLLLLILLALFQLASLAAGEQLQGRCLARLRICR